MIEGAFFRASVWAINTSVWEACVRCIERLSGEIVVSVASPGHGAAGDTMLRAPRRAGSLGSSFSGFWEDVDECSCELMGRE